MREVAAVYDILGLAKTSVFRAAHFIIPLIGQLQGPNLVLAHIFKAYDGLS